MGYNGKREMEMLINGLIYFNFNIGLFDTSVLVYFNFNSCKSAVNIKKLHECFVRVIFDYSRRDYQALLGKNGKSTIEIKRKKHPFANVIQNRCS